MYNYKIFKGTEFHTWFQNLPDFVLLADDIIFSTWVKKQGHKLFKIIQSRSNLIKHDPKETTELNTQNDLGGNNEKVYNYFEDMLKNTSINKLIKDSENNSFAKFVSSQKENN